MVAGRDPVESDPRPSAVVAEFGEAADPDPRAPTDRLLRDLRTGPSGLSEREAQRRLVRYGPNELQRARRISWVRQLVRQFTHPLGLLLWAAAALAVVTGSVVLGWAIATVIVVNALFAFAQERQAERAVEALQKILAAHASVLRDGRRRHLETRLVPGDIVLIAEGERIPADARLLQGALEMDLSALTGESQPVLQSADPVDADVPFLQSPDLVFSGASCLGGDARAVVFATGMQTELGRIAALSARVRTEESPLEAQVRRAAVVIAAVAVGLGLLFLPLGTLAAGLSLRDSDVFAVGLLVANVPEGLLPTITLALAVGVRVLARRGAVVKRLSAVETLGSTTVICTDKTGTLTENRMQVTRVWTLDGQWEPASPGTVQGTLVGAVAAVAAAVAACNSAEVDVARGTGSGDPTEVALLLAVAGAGVDVRVGLRDERRLAQFHFDPKLKLMSTVDWDADGIVLHTKGAPEEVLARCTRAMSGGGDRPLTPADAARILEVIDRDTAAGLRLLGVASRRLAAAPDDRRQRSSVEAELCFLGAVALYDPPRPEVADAVAVCHRAGIRVIVVSGDHPGVLTNRLLLAGIAFELAFALALTYAPPLQGLFDTAPLPPQLLLLLLPFPFIVWAVDDVHRRLVRARRAGPIVTDGAVA